MLFVPFVSGSFAANFETLIDFGTGSIEDFTGIGIKGNLIFTTFELFSGDTASVSIRLLTTEGSTISDSLPLGSKTGSTIISSLSLMFSVLISTSKYSSYFS